MSNVAVIIVSYNTCALLRDCLASLQACTLPLQVLVVDNGSHDGSVAMVRHTFPHVHLLEPGANVGFAQANNLGLAWFAQQPAALPAYVLLLNPDTIVHHGALEALVAFLAQHPRVGLVGPRLLNPDGTHQAAAFRFPTLLMTLLDLFPPGEVLPGRLYGSWWHGRYPQERGTAPFAIDHPLGACMLVRRAVLEEVGPLNADYFMYSEEVEWCWRIRQAGWAIWQVPDARVTHIGGAATSQLRHSMFSALWQSRARFAAQRGPAWRIATHHALVQAGMLRLSLKSWRAYRQGRLSRNELRAHLWAYGEAGKG
ncbi:MAG: glycosyltransferase family 2 protein [Candidatus Viridilinea halotolerans]|uniref:Glycosyltransferase family 2 protein n=1 Tax=Candidatus Viridilinea halotolerans TaxID=2491704 RepID=A0A426TTJ2_9CHLR|nr:MAG: glycosyltransferase family 2 protein [Candidatus Viridilinea halotolerans]